MTQRLLTWLLLLLVTSSGLSAQPESQRAASQSATHTEHIPPTATTNKLQTVTYDGTWYSVDGGGGVNGAGGSVSLGGTIGQPDAGQLAGTDLTLRGGFWGAVETDVLVLISEVFIATDELIEVPISFSSSGFAINATTFSVDFDESCLSFDPTDVDGDGFPDSISFSLPTDSEVSVTYDASDLDGEIDFSIFDFDEPLAVLPDGEMASIEFTTSCHPSEDPIQAAVAFSEMPPPTFGNPLGQDVPGRGIHGSVNILPGIRGDCNNDQIVTAGDLPACVLEVFDGDPACWLNAAEGTFPGSPVGCDANGDGLINAGDLSCKILLIFEGPGACDVAQRRSLGWDTPILSLSKIPQLADRYAQVKMAVTLRAHGWEINSLAFSIDYDESAFTFDPSDKDGDGIPDAVTLDLPVGAQASVIFDPTDADGEIDISVLDPYQVLDRGSGLPFITIALKPHGLLKPGEANISFANDPAVSFGDLSGQSVGGLTHDAATQ